MVWCSWTTPSMRTPQTAAPRSDESSMRRIALPSVWPKPRSSGWRRNSATLGLSSRLVASPSCGRTSPRRSIVDAMGYSVSRVIPACNGRKRSASPPTRGRLVEGLGPRPTKESLTVQRSDGRVAQRDSLARRPSDCQTVRPLLRVQLDDQLFLGGDRDARAGRLFQHATAERLLVHGDPRERRAARRLIHRRHHGHLLSRLHPHADFLARHDVEARDVHRRLVHFDMAVADELAGGLAARREAHAIHDVVEARLERGQQVVTRDAGLRADLLERVAELLLAHTVDALDLLLLTELLGDLRRLAAARRRLAMLAGRVRATLDGALLGEALGALEEKLRSLAAALAAARTCITTHLRLSDASGDRSRCAGSASRP